MNLYILGNGGFAHELFDHLFLKENTHSFLGFITIIGDKAFVIGEQGIKEFSPHDDAAFTVGTLNPLWRTKFIEYFVKLYPLSPSHFPNISSDKSSISAISTIGVGNVFLPFSSVNGMSSIGNFNSFSSYSSVYNRCKIGNNNVVYPYAGIMRQCNIGNNNKLYANSIITEKVSIGNDNIVSAGECVFDSMEDNELFQSGITQNRKDI